MRNTIHQVESLTGETHASTENAGVLRCAGCVQTSLVDQRRKTCLTFTRSVRKPNVRAFVTWWCLQHDDPDDPPRREHGDKLGCCFFGVREAPQHVVMGSALYTRCVLIFYIFRK